MYGAIGSVAALANDSGYDGSIVIDAGQGREMCNTSLCYSAALALPADVAWNARRRRLAGIAQ
ncbi:MAG: hypothetical protein WDZ83_04375 [Rhizobiaceae bacterium]